MQVKIIKSNMESIIDVHFIPRIGEMVVGVDFSGRVKDIVHNYFVYTPQIINIYLEDEK
jgi:hypothetical protein